MHVRVALLLLLLVGSAAAQYPPDVGEATQPLDEALGDTVPPALNMTYDTLGQDINREDVRLFLDMDINQGSVGLGGLLVGSSNIEVQADISIRGEMRVIASERVAAAAFGENPYNASADNATFLAHAYLPAEVFRLTLTAEIIAAFQEEQEKALRDMIERTVPELEIINLDVAWENTEPQEALKDFSLTESPIIFHLDASVQYLRVESLGSLLGTYFEAREDRDEGKRNYVQSLKADHGDVLRTRDFFAAAAYTQLLNMSMQPGWSLDVSMSVPRGFTFEYFNDNVTVSEDRRTMTFRVDATESDENVEHVLLASLTQRRAVALALFVSLWIVATVTAFGPRTFYLKHRVPRMLQPPLSSADPASED